MRRTGQSGQASLNFLELAIYSGIATMTLLWLSGMIKPYFRVQATLSQEITRRGGAEALELPIADIRATSAGAFYWPAIDSTNATEFKYDQSPWFELPGAPAIPNGAWVCYRYAGPESRVTRVFVPKANAAQAAPAGACSPPAGKEQVVASNILPPTPLEPLFQKETAAQVVILRLRVHNPYDNQKSYTIVRRAAMRND